jgi:hypothetical protein
MQRGPAVSRAGGLSDCHSKEGATLRWGCYQVNGRRTMIPLEKEIWGIAAAVVSHKQTAAVEYAEQRAQQALEADDEVNCNIWLAVKCAVIELMRSPEHDENVN